MKINLTDFTFIIPVKYDHQDRADNLALVKSHILHFFDTNIIVGEIQTNKMDADMHFNYNAFHRTKALNEMTRAAKTPYVVNYDADVLFSPFQIIDMANKLRNGADMVYPFDGRFAGVDRIYYKYLLSDFSLMCLSGKQFRLMGSMNPMPVIGVLGSIGGAVGFNKEKYLAIGGENENFISWGPEDVERYWRAKMFQLRIERTFGTLFHIDHHRGKDSRIDTEESKRNHAYWDWLQQRTKQEVMEHLGVDPQRGYAGGWKLEDAIKEHAFSLELAYYINQILDVNNLKTVYDFGAGPGFYSRFLYERGHGVYAYDSGDNNAISLFDVHCKDVLTFERNAMDCVLCLEVGEHVPQQDEQRLLDVISKHASRKIIMSWAIPGQGGFGHVNCRDNDYIIAQMKERGWKLNIPESNLLRQHCTGCDWFEKTILVFDKS